MGDPTVLYGHLSPSALIALLGDRDHEILQQKSTIQALTEEVENLKKEKDEILQSASIQLSREDG